MDQTTAEIIVLVTGAIGLGFWYWAITSFRGMKSLPALVKRSDEYSGIGVEEAMESILRALVGGAQQFHVLDRGEDWVTFEPSPVMPAQHNSTPATMTLRVEPATAGVTVHSETDFSKQQRNYLRVMGALVLVLEPAVICGAVALIWFLVVPNNHPAVRWQVMQTLQIGHVLWPPFLVNSLYKKSRRTSENSLNNLLIRFELGE